MKYYNSFNELYNSTCNTQNLSVFNVYVKDVDNGYRYTINLPVNLNDEVSAEKGKKAKKVKREWICSLVCQINKSGFFHSSQSSEQALLTIKDEYVDVLMPVFYSLAAKMDGVALKQKDNDILIKNIDGMSVKDFKKVCGSMMVQAEKSAKSLLRDVQIDEADNKKSKYTYPQGEATKGTNVSVEKDGTGDLDVADKDLKSDVSRGLIAGIPSQNIPTTVKGKNDNDEVIK
jgi:hypothetical protein